MHMDKPVLGQITQGTIFTAAVAENYPKLPVWGLCITARCDVAHENKTRVFNYLPVVRFEDWLAEDGARAIIERLWGEVRGSAKDHLAKKDISDSVLDFYTPEDIADKFFPLDKSGKDGEKFREITRKLTKLISARTTTPLTNEALSEITAYNKKTVEKFIKEIWANQLASYYFLPHIGDTEHSSKLGYIVLLREIYHISRNAAEAIANGATVENSAITKSQAKAYDFSVFDFSYPTAQLKSPWIEHLMQQFSLLFSRIGLPDPSQSSLKNLLEAMSNGA